MHGREVKRLLAAVGGQRLEAGVAQDHAQRPQDLGLVIADEHDRLLTHAGTPLVHGEADHEARALARQRLNRDRAAVGLDEALGDRQAEA